MKKSINVIFLFFLICFSFFSCKFPEYYARVEEVNINFKIDLTNYTENYNYLYASIYDASGIKTKNKGEFTYQNIDFDTLPNGYSVKKAVKVGEKLDLTINNVPVGLNAIVVVELLNNFGNTSTVVYGGVSDVFTIENSSNYKINLENLSLSNSVDDSSGSSNAVGKKVYITFDSNGGIGEMPKQEFTVGSVSVLNQNVFVNDGYKFLKWNTASDGSGSDYFDCANVKIDRDLTLYAIWVTEEEVIYKIEHYKQNLKDDNYTLFESEYKTGMESDKLTQSAKEYIGYNLSNVVLSNEGTVVKVYYDCILCTVTFEFNDETINLDNTQVVKYGATLQKPEISSENKYLYNWYSDEDFTTIFDFATIVKEDITLYAKWIDLTSSSYEVTDSNVVNVIGNLSGEGPHYVKVTGEISSNTISTIRTKLINKSSCLVILDLSETTGLNSFSEYHYNGVHSGGYIEGYCSNGNCSKYNFNSCTNLVGIILPDTLKTIGDFSFYKCSNLKNIVIPESVKTIGKEAFYYCPNLETIELSENLESIGESAFYDCSKLENIELPKNLTTVGGRAFYYCKKLKSIEIPEGVESLENIFYGCSNLKYLKIPNSLVISDYTFFNTLKLNDIYINSDNPNFVLENGCLFTSDKSILCLITTDVVDLVIPETVTEVYNIKQFDNLQTVKFLNPYTVTCTNSFEHCESLITVESVGDFTAEFYGCYNLKSVIGLGGNEHSSFYECFDLEYIKFKSKITKIRPQSFKSCVRLQNIDITYLPKSCSVSGYTYVDSYIGNWTSGYTLNAHILNFREDSTDGSWTLYY